MFSVGETVLVVTEKGIAFDGHIMARAIGDEGGPPAYQVAVHKREQNAQWHKACDVFIVEEAKKEEMDSIENFLKKLLPPGDTFAPNRTRIIHARADLF
jgi:hypothetical protein